MKDAEIEETLEAAKSFLSGLKEHAITQAGVIEGAALKNGDNVVKCYNVRGDFMLGLVQGCTIRFGDDSGLIDENTLSLFFRGGL